MSSPIERMYTLLSERGLTEAEFARRIQESQQTVNNWKRRGAIPAGKFHKVTRALGVSYEWLTGASPKSTSSRAGSTGPVSPEALERPIGIDDESAIFAECLTLLPEEHRGFLWRALRLLANQIDLSEPLRAKLIHLISTGERFARRRRQAA